jgi:small subunit ribosomal protein S18
MSDYEGRRGGGGRPGGGRPGRGGAPSNDMMDMEGGARRYRRKPRICAFCADKVKLIDYKDHERLRRFVSDHGQIKPRRQTGTCSRHQRALAIAIKRARHLALLPFSED